VDNIHFSVLFNRLVLTRHQSQKGDGGMKQLINKLVEKVITSKTLEKIEAKVIEVYSELTPKVESKPESK
jgi:hypothetical protein